MPISAPRRYVFRPSRSRVGTKWGWRIPFFVGCIIVPVLFMIRRSLQETEELMTRKHKPAVREILRSMVDNRGLVVAGMMLVSMTTVSFYLITVYTPTFGKSVLKLTTIDALVLTFCFCVGVSNFIWLPVIGALSDRITTWHVDDGSSDMWLICNTIFIPQKR